MSTRKAYLLYRRPEGGKDGKVWYVSFWSPEEGRYIKRQSTHTVDEDQAHNIAEAMLKRGIVPIEDDPPIAVFLKDFWRADSFYARTKALRRPELSPRYIELNAAAVRLFVETSGL